MQARRFLFENTSWERLLNFGFKLIPFRLAITIETCFESLRSRTYLPSCSSSTKTVDGFLRLRCRVSYVFRSQPIYELIGFNSSSIPTSEVERFVTKLLINFLTRCTLPGPSYCQSSRVFN